VETLCIIPARGGSKGIPRKNVQAIAGKPLIAYTIEQAKCSNAITRVVVSTDDDEIASVSHSYGAEVLHRPAEIAGDKASSESALLHALDHLKQQEGYGPDLVVFLQATSPLRQPNDIDNAVDTLLRENADSLFSARPVEGFIWEERKQDGACTPINYDPTDRPTRQALASEYLEENGSIYVFKPWVLREYNSRLGGKIAVYVMHELDSFQVDVPEDLGLMEQLIRLRLPAGLHSELACVELLLFDFDGVMTDNRVLVMQDGTEGVFCHRGDGLGIGQLREMGVAMAVLSTEMNPVVSARCKKLEIECIQGCADKRAKLQELARERSLDPAQIAFVGNDVNDLACMAWVGIPIAVADALPEVKRAARLVTSHPGGLGAVREITEWVREAKRSAGEGVL